MSAASVMGVRVTPEALAAARAFLGRGGVLTFDGAIALAPLFLAAASHGAPFETAVRCMLGPPCAHCKGPIEAGGDELDAGWICEACAAPIRQRRAFWRRAARWFTHKQLALFDVGEGNRRRARRKVKREAGARSGRAREALEMETLFNEVDDA